jgi:D-lactate dehydrogenase
VNVAVFSTKRYDQAFLDAANEGVHQLRYYEPHLDSQTVALAQGADAVCAFVNDRLDSHVIDALAGLGARLIAMRCAGFNNVDLHAAARAHISVVRVPAYSPHAVAEHAVALVLALNRKIHRAYNRVREGNFALEGLLGFDLYNRTVGVVGTGKIGIVFAEIMRGFGCELLAYDPFHNPAAEKTGVHYVELEELLSRSDIISLHCPLTPENHHLINERTLASMRNGAMLINTSRGALVDAQAAIDALKTGKLGYLGLDVYEEEADLFFEDLSGHILQDDVFSRLLTFPNVIITGHQAFFTETALRAIARTTITNITDWERTGACANEVKV